MMFPCRPLWDGDFCESGKEGCWFENLGTCKRHITHGMMKYRGSTRGAVISERAVVSTNMRRKEVLGSCSSVELIGAECCGFLICLSVDFEVGSIVSSKS